MKEIADKGRSRRVREPPRSPDSSKKSPPLRDRSRKNMRNSLSKNRLSNLGDSEKMRHGNQSSKGMLSP